MTVPPAVRPSAISRRLAGPRLALCAVIGGAVAMLGPGQFGLPFRVALGWVVGVALFLALTALAIKGATVERIRHHAREEDEHGWLIFFILVAGASVSLLALGFLVRGGASAGWLATALRAVLGGLAVIASWTLTHTTFAFRYAHLFYGDADADPGDDGGLAFPREPAPDYWDFLYFSFVIGMTCQVSDVQVTSRRIRRLALAHGVLSFLFNTIILALAVNLLASMV